jgi:hypothetical protein
MYMNIYILKLYTYMSSYIHTYSYEQYLQALLFRKGDQLLPQIIEMRIIESGQLHQNHFMGRVPIS